MDFSRQFGKPVHHVIHEPGDIGDHEIVQHDAPGNEVAQDVDDHVINHPWKLLEPPPYVSDESRYGFRKEHDYAVPSLL